MNVDPLARRAWLGLEVDASLVVAGVDAGGPGDAAGLVKGDAVVAIDGVPVVPDAREIVRAMRGKVVGSTSRLSIVRGGETLERTLTLAPLPVETVEGGVVELGHLLLGTHRLRTIVTRPIDPLDPRARARAKREGVVLLPALDAISVEHPLDRDHPTRFLLRALTAANVITMRVERGGVGDSEGPHARDTGLDEELVTHDAAIEALRARDDVDPKRIFLFAPSFGGMIAPLLARDRDLAGIVVFGSSSRAWDDCVMRTMIRQKKLAGTTDDALAPFVARWAELVALVVRERWTPDEVFRELPHLRACRSRDADGRRLLGRDVSLFQDIVTHDLVAAWRAAPCPVRVLHGEHDWVSSLDEAKEIADAARAELVELPHIGHDLRAHASLRDSFERKIPGENDPRVAQAIVDAIRSFARRA
jgi:pimeloyl-ACP methyl ester carboxylesterase